MLALILFLIIPAAFEPYILKVQTNCNMNPQIYYFKYSPANYGPSIPVQTELLYISQKDFCKDINQYQLIYLFILSKKQSVLVPRGNCTFVEKTARAQKLNINLLIIYDTTDSNIIPIGTQNFVNTTTIWIGNQTYQQIKKLYSSCSRIKISTTNLTSIPQGILMKNIELPNVFFDINQPREMEYLSQFYRHQLFEPFLAGMELNHKIIYTSNYCSNNQCDPSKDCLLSQPIDGKLFCYQTEPQQQHSGKRVMIQQIRSFSILQTLGGKMWFMFRQLFYHNLCQFDPQILNCVDRIYRQLGINPNQIYQLIDKKTQQYQNAKFIQKLINNNTLIKVLPRHQMHYASQIPQMFQKICQNSKIIHRQCSMFNKQPTKMMINTNQRYFQEFQMVQNHRVLIQVNQSVFGTLDEVVIILTNRPFIFESLQNIDLVSEYIQTDSNAKIQGRFGFVSDIDQNNLQLSSKKDLFGHVYLIMKKKQIVMNKFSLLLTLTVNFRYKMMVWAKPQNYVMRLGDHCIDVAQSQGKYITIQYQFDEKQNETDILLAIFSRRKQYGASKVVHFYRIANNTVDKSYELSSSYYNSWQVKHPNDYLKVFYTPASNIKIFQSLVHNCQQKVNQKLSLTTICRYALYASSQPTTGTILAISLIKIQRKKLKPMNHIILGQLRPDLPIVQRLKLDEKLFPLKINEFKMSAYSKIPTHYSKFAYMHEYRSLKQNQKDFETIQQWNRDYLKRTQLLFHTQFVNNSEISTLQMSHPYNTLKQHLKIRNITIYLVYKMVVPKSAALLWVQQTFTMKDVSTNKMVLLPNTYEDSFLNRKYQTQEKYSTSNYNNFETNSLLQIPLKQENIRIFARVYSYTTGYHNTKKSQYLTSKPVYKFFKAKYPDKFTHYADNFTQLLHHKHAQYYEISQKIYEYMYLISQDVMKFYGFSTYSPTNINYITDYDVLIQIINKSIPLPNNLIYVIGNTKIGQISNADNQRQFKVGRKSLVLTNPIKQKQQTFSVTANKMIRIFTLESLFSQFTYKLQVYVYSKNNPEQTRMINYTQQIVKYWKDLETDQVVKGIKISQSVDQIIVSLPTNAIVSENFNQTNNVSIINGNISFDFYVKAKLNNYQKMVQIRQELIKNDTQKGMVLVDNHEDIIREEYQKKEKINDEKKKIQDKTAEKQQTFPILINQKKQESPKTVEKKQNVPVSTSQKKQESPKTVEKKQNVPVSTNQKKQESPKTVEKKQNVPVSTSQKKQESPKTVEKKQNVPVSTNQKKQESQPQVNSDSQINSKTIQNVRENNFSSNLYKSIVQVSKQQSNFLQHQNVIILIVVLIILVLLMLSFVIISQFQLLNLVRQRIPAISNNSIQVTQNQNQSTIMV